MLATRADRADSLLPKPLVVFAVLSIVLALRIVHLSAAVQSPLSYQPGPDEDYYQRFGVAVAAGHGADSAEFTFMDPGYGYVLGWVFKAAGVNPFVVYLLQALLDTATAWGIVCIGRQLGRPWAGVYGALLYGLTATAIMFSTALLKETCVAAFMTWWVAGALAVYRSDRKLAWLAFGMYCGVGVALRSTLAVFGLVAVLLPGLASWSRRVGDPAAAPPRSPSDARLLAALSLAGLAASLLPWSIRNFNAFGGISPLPHNGGIVLHQAYNRDNPDSAIWIPPFVSYLHPSEIWHGYAAEAQRRSGRTMSPPQIDGYWRGEALAFMREHPAAVFADVGRKSLIFLADSEIPNNRSSAEERLFSPLLNALPRPMAWLLAMGLAGLVWLAVQDRRWPLVAVPVAVAWMTVAAFWAEDRFRFHAVPLLALSSGVWVDGMVQGIRGVRRRQMILFAVCAALIGAGSVLLGRHFPSPAVRWDRVVWGYIKMGKLSEAHSLAERTRHEQPDNAPIMEALGYIAAAGQHYPEAVQDYQRAIELRPGAYLAHYNLAKTWLALGEKQKAVEEARLALGLSPSPETQALVNQAETAP